MWAFGRNFCRQGISKKSSRTQPNCRHQKILKTLRTNFATQGYTYLCRKNIRVIMLGQECMHASSTSAHVFMSHRDTCGLLEQEHKYSRGAKPHVFWFDHEACVLLEQEPMSSCWTRQPVFRLTTGSHVTCTPVEPEHMCSCWEITRQDHMHSYSSRTHSSCSCSYNVHAVLCNGVYVVLSYDHAYL